MIKKFKEYLEEARKNPDKNRKISAYEALKKYKDDPNIYISFTELKKIGIKPITEYNTPNGIYTYPLKEIWDDIEDEMGTKFSIPFAGDRPYIFVLKYNGAKKFVNNMHTDYTSKNYDEDVKKLKEIFISYIEKNKIIDKLILKDTISMSSTKNIKKFYKEIYTKFSKELNDIKCSELFAFNMMKNILSDFNIDTYDKTIENISDYFFDIKYSDTFYDLDNGKTYPLLPLNKVKQNIEKITVSDFDEMNWNQLLRDAIATAEKKNPISIFWNLTRLMANYVKGDNSQNWNNILRQLGYVGFADKSAKGYIHEAEPLQAMFLTTAAFKVEEMIMNINPARNYALEANVENGEYKSDWDDGIWDRTDVIFSGKNWYKGTFKNGTWNGETFHEGIWKNGTWKGGIFRKGTWENGTWENGGFYNSTWYNGIWKNGKFVKGHWENGTWENGEWHDGIWENGEWINGKWIIGKIYSKKFNIYIKSKVSPKNFYLFELNTNDEETFKNIFKR